MRPVASLLLLACSGCATHRGRVEQRMLSIPSASRYDMLPEQLFVMPLSLGNEAPGFGTLASLRTLPPTTVCVELMISETGAVSRVTPLREVEDCADADDESVSVLRGQLESDLLQWRYDAAAICTFPDAQARERARGACIGEGVVRQSVAVTLAYAFTFEISNGKRTVRSSAR